MKKKKTQKRKSSKKVASADTAPVISHITTGSVFYDLFDKEEADELELRYQLLSTIGKIIKRHEYTQKELVNLLGMKQPHVSSLIHEKPEVFSLEKLFEILGKLGANVRVEVDPPKKKRA